MNHFAKVCRSKSQDRSGPQDRGRSTSPRRGFNSQQAETTTSSVGVIGMIEAKQSAVRVETAEIQQVTPKRSGTKIDNTVRDLRMIEITLSTPSGAEVEAKALPDSGANVNILPKKIGQKFGMSKTDVETPTCANGSGLKIFGKVTTDLIHGERQFIDVEWQVANSPKIILSEGLLKQMGLLPKQFPLVHIAGEANVHAVEALVKICEDEEINNIANKYPEVFCGRVTMMRGKPATIELTNDATPTSTGHYRTIANAYLEPLKKELDTQVAAGIIEKIAEKPDAAKYWLHPIVVVPKKGTKDVRLCVDFRKLNKFCLRPTNPQKTPFETVRSLPKGERFFAVCDALKGYHQIALDEESKTKTAFFTPFGIYRYTSLPMGYAASQDIFTDRFGGAVDDVVQARVTEDCLITASDRQMFLKRLDKFFARCKEAGIVLNTKKFQMGSEVIFGGFKLNANGYSLDPSLHDAIRKFPPPTNITELRSFMGLVNQATSFTKKIAGLTSPLKELLKSKNEYVWTAEHQEAFEKAREELSVVQELTYFDHRRPTKLFTDASRLNGLGFVLKQEQNDGSWRIVQAGSRFLSSAETRYAMVELELLAIAWAMQKARPYLEGIKFDVMTDHKPLIPILNNYALSEIENKRLQRLKMKLDGFTFEAHHIAGKDNIEADALSRAPVNQPTTEDEIDENEDASLPTSKQALAVLNSLEVETEVWLPEENAKFEAYMVDKQAEDIREAGEEDQDYRKVKKWLCDKYQVPKEEATEHMSKYYKELEKFSLDENGLLCYDDRVVIPKSLRSRYVDLLVHLHASPTKMKARARRSIWWPTMNAQIDERWRQCRTCVEKSPSNKPEPTKPREISKYPFQIMHMDLGSYGGYQFLVIVDQFTGWPVVKEMRKDTTTKSLISELRYVFEQYGLPETIYSDGGPQFGSEEFKQFCEEWRINHVTSSPHYPQSNGIAENGVKAMKKLIHCCYDPVRGCINPDEWTKAMMIYKNTPRGGSNLAPAEVLFGKLLRDGVPVNFNRYVPKHRAAVKRRWDETQRYMDQLYDFRKSSDKIKMDIGDRVFIQDARTKEWLVTGTIEKRGQNEREFWVRTDKGGLWRRNRRFLKLQDPVKRQQERKKIAKTEGKSTKKVGFAKEEEVRTSDNKQEEQDYRKNNQQQPGGRRRGTRQRKQPDRWGYNQ